MNGDLACRLGVDVGGTFTDLVLLTRDGRLVTRKVLSTSGTMRGHRLRLAERDADKAEHQQCSEPERYAAEHIHRADGIAGVARWSEAIGKNSQPEAKSEGPRASEARN